MNLKKLPPAIRLTIEAMQNKKASGITVLDLSSLGTFIFYNLVIGASIPGISNAAHVGGLVMGAVVGALLPAASASESARRTRLSLVVAFCAASLFAFAVAAKHLRSSVAKFRPQLRVTLADTDRPTAKT